MQDKKRLSEQKNETSMQSQQLAAIAKNLVYPIIEEGCLAGVEEPGIQYRIFEDIVNGQFVHSTADRNTQNEGEIRFIDLFAGIGGIRLGLEQALSMMGYESRCVFTSEIKKHAIRVLSQNHPNEPIYGDITQIPTDHIPDFDILCGGFPCQAFSQAGNRDGFADTRGTMFFEVERIIKAKRPKAFILENVEGLVNHNGGDTLDVILNNLHALDYDVTYKVLNARDFGVAQDRRRVYFIGCRNDNKKSHAHLKFHEHAPQRATLGEILERGLPTSDSDFVRLLLQKFGLDALKGMSIKDKRGGSQNIHSWDLELKGSVSNDQKKLLNALMLERRKKKWADIIGIEWMDGMPLTKSQIEQFYQHEKLQVMLDELVEKGYLRYEYPKQRVVEKKVAPNGDLVQTSRRVYDMSKPKGYNIVAGKLSFEVGKILNPDEVAPTLVATDMQHLYVIDGTGLRKLTLREGLRLFGYTDTYKFDLSESDGFDLLGNTVVVPVIKYVAESLISQCRL